MGVVKITKNLSARELLDKTYENLEKKFGHRTIEFQEPALAEIANDSDWHRTRIGYMEYENADLFKFNGNEWALAIGRACGSYPADPYDTDITAILCNSKEKEQEDTQKELMRGFRCSSYFRNSIVYSMSDGSLAINKESKIGNRFLEIVKPKIAEYVAKGPEYHGRFMTMDLRPVVTARAEYKPKFADFLTETIVKILSEKTQQG